MSIITWTQILTLDLIFISIVATVIEIELVLYIIQLILQKSDVMTSDIKDLTLFKLPKMRILI